MTSRIRRMLPDDRTALCKILEAIAEFTPAEVTVAIEVIDSYLQNHDSSGYDVLIAETDTGIAGYICYGPTPLTQGIWDIYWMATSPEKQGQGIGSSLLAKAEGRIGESGGRLAIIETSSKPEYEKTRHFHFRHGYEEIARIPDFYAPGDDKIILQKRLNLTPNVQYEGRFTQ